MAIRLTAAPKAIMVATSTMVEAIISVSPAGSLHRSGDRSCDLPPMICGPTPTSGEPRSCSRRGKGLHDRVPPSCGFGFVHGKIGRDLMRAVCPIMAFKALFKAPALYCTGVFAPSWFFANQENPNDPGPEFNESFQAHLSAMDLVFFCLPTGPRLYGYATRPEQRFLPDESSQSS